MKKNPISCYYLYMKNLNEDMIFTSVNLPNWQLSRIFAICNQIKGQNLYSIIEYCTQRYLSLRTLQVKRNQAHQYNKSPAKYSKISVYWEIEFYNKLRMQAHHSRMSASLLIHLALLAFLCEMSEKNSLENIDDFCRYQNQILEITASTLSIMEKLYFLSSPDQ